VPDTAPSDEIAAIRERLARLETGMDVHERAAAERHREVLAAVEVVRQRLDAVEARSWKLALALAALGLGGGAGAREPSSYCVPPWEVDVRPVASRSWAPRGLSHARKVTRMHRTEGWRRYP
jgi:hypothetical protein